MKTLSESGRSARNRSMAAVTALLLAGAGSVFASSHREAPFVTEHPKVDGTDFYMFNSYEPGREGFVTIIADYLPLQDPYGGPNYFTMDPDAIYDIHIDNNGDAREDLTFRFRFNNKLQNIALNIDGQTVPVPLINVGQIGPGMNDIGALNVIENYTVDLISGDSNSGTVTPLTDAMTGGRWFRKPVDNIGLKSIPNYENYALSHVYSINIPGSNATGRLFVGQRKDPFVVNLGETFDLVNTNPLGPENGERDSLSDKNVTCFIIEVPAASLTRGSETVIGGWTTASMHEFRQLVATPSYGWPAKESGPFIQVSRLGMPLVNEVVIGIKDKDLFNASKPSSDGQFASYVTNPTLPALLQALFGVTAPCTPRNDLVTVFLTGVPGVNQPANVVASEMLRLNTNVNPKGGIPAQPRGKQNRLGVIGGDLAGFPNGRRPGDDVVDIALRVVMGKLLDSACAPQGQLPYTDGAFLNDQAFSNHFPYLAMPIPGSPNK